MGGWRSAVSQAVAVAQTLQVRRACGLGTICLTEDAAFGFDGNRSHDAELEATAAGLEEEDVLMVTEVFDTDALYVRHGEAGSGMVTMEDNRTP